MAPFNSGNQYDPVGSQYNQQHQRGYYTAAPQYNEPSTTAASYQASYPTATYQSDPTSYYNWNNASTSQPQATVDNRAAEALSSMSAQDQAAHASSRATSTAQYGAYDNTYSSTSNPPRPASTREQSNTSPVYQAPQTARANLANYRPASNYTYPAQPTATQQQPAVTQQSQSPVTSYQFPARSQPSQQTSQSRSPYQSQAQPSQYQPPKTTRRTERTSFSTANNNTSDVPAANVGQPRAPSMTPTVVQQQSSNQYSQQRQTQEASAPTTVDPSQVYDAWPEQQRRIREAEARRKAEEAAMAKAKKEEDDRRAAADAKARAEEAAKKAEEERKAAEEAHRRRQLEAEEAKRRQLEADAQRRQVDAAEAQRRQHETAEVQRRQYEAAEAQKRQFEAAQDAQKRQAAAPPSQAALDFASQAGAPPGSDLETEMLAMFKKMREFNEKNPAMLARLWDKERRAHLAKSQTPVASPAQAKTAHAPPSSRPQSFQPPAHAGPASSTGPASSATVNPSARSAAAVASTSTVAKPVSGQAPKPMASASTVPVAAPAPAAAPATQVGHPLVSQPGHQSIWPPGKKAHLAEAASKWLNAKPQNASKQISKERLIALLDTNPSYLTLCEVLEDMGLAVDRGPFARALLSAVPGAKQTPAVPPGNSRQKKPVELTPTQSTPAAESLNKPRSGNIGKMGRQRGRPSRDALLAQNHPPGSIIHDEGFVPPPDDDYHAPQAPMVASTLTTDARQSPYNQQANSGRPTVAGENVPRPTHPQAPRRPPANKEEAARKRTFADLIDLTAMDNSDDEDPIAKAPKITATDVAHGRSIFNQLSGSFDQHNDTGTSSFTAGPHNDAGQSLPTQTEAPHIKSAEPAVTSLELELRDKVLVQGIRRSKAARKSTYDPRTICRDVLLATGRHPEARALNQHLFGMHDFLKRHSTNIEGDKFDLGTIRWDLIDPGEPIAELLNERVPDAGAEADVEDEATGPAAMKDSTPDPAHRRKPYLMKKRVGRPPKSSMPNTDTSRVESDGETPAKRQRGTQASASVSRSTPQVTTATFTPVNNPSNNKPSSGMSGGPSSGAIGYSAFRKQLDADGNPVKRLGRPVGWRKSLHSKEAMAAAAAGRPLPASSTGPKRTVPPTSYDQVQRRPGRPSKQQSQPQSAMPEPTFNVYKCEWEGCKAELHNVGTLRKHIFKLHGKLTDGKYECFWDGCIADRSSEEYDYPFVFDKIEEWLGHVESTHLQPLARKLGDGPRRGLSEPHDSEASDAYMSDATGRIVTPKIRESPMATEGSEEWEALMERNAAARRMSKLSGVALENEQLLQQLEEKKRKVGPGLDRAGCTFMNDARRRGFYDNEDFEDIIDSDGIA